MVLLPIGTDDGSHGNGVLVKQLQQLAVMPNNPYQSHTQACLHLLERRRRLKQQQANAAIPSQHSDTSTAEAEQESGNRQGDKSGIQLRRRYSATAQGNMKEPVLSDPSLRKEKNRQIVSPCSLPDLASELSEYWPLEVIKPLSLVRQPVLHDSTDQIVQQFEATGGLRLECGVFQMPHPKKVDTGGEDSYFILQPGEISMGSQHFTAAGVADGVGEWDRRFQLNPRAFADELMEGAARNLRSSSASRTVSNDEAARLCSQDLAQTALQDSFEITKSFGSATALIAVLDAESGELGVSNLGDSGLRHIRRRPDSITAFPRVLNRTIDQQHSFNCPFQLCRLPVPEDFPRLKAEGKGALVRAVQKTPLSRLDTPSSADRYSFRVQEGDFILIGTDGLFDNLHDREICSLVSLATPPTLAKSKQPGTDPRAIAETLAQAAYHRSVDSSAKTPFCATAKDAGLCHIGGKMDDITVVVAWVMRD